MAKLLFFGFWFEKPAAIIVHPVSTLEEPEFLHFDLDGGWEIKPPSAWS